MSSERQKLGLIYQHSNIQSPQNDDSGILSLSKSRTSQSPLRPSAERVYSPKAGKHDYSFFQMVSKTEDRSHAAMEGHVKNHSTSVRDFNRDFGGTPDQEL
jgi:hypothetical protein